MASMALALARIRPFILNEIDHPIPFTSLEHIAFCRTLLVEVDEALDGTIHSFTPNSKEAR